jgi:hypothetical protein
MNSHNGGVISLDTGGLLCKSTEQKFDTKSSTEAALVGATNYLSNTIWLKLCLEAQVHGIITIHFEQDNVSAIHLEKNVCVSAGNQFSHIDIQYLFMKAGDAI